MEAVVVHTSAGDGQGAQAARAGYRRSAGTPRAEARRQELLDRVTDDLAVNGLVGFSLRRAARAAGATHKVLLYHFESAEDLLTQALFRLRERRIANITAAAVEPGQSTLADRIRAVWPVLKANETGLRVIEQAIGLVMYDPERYAELGRNAADQYEDLLLAFQPEDWSDERKAEVSGLLLAVFRGFLMDWRTTGETERIDAGLRALERALEREEEAGG
jgi:AcrR family transcriptional regulator